MEKLVLRVGSIYNVMLVITFSYTVGLEGANTIHPCLLLHCLAYDFLLEEITTFLISAPEVFNEFILKCCIYVPSFKKVKRVCVFEVCTCVCVCVCV